MRSHTKKIDKRIRSNSFTNTISISKYDLIDKIIEFQKQKKIKEALILEKLLLNSIAQDKSNRRYLSSININKIIQQKYFKY